MKKHLIAAAVAAAVAVPAMAQNISITGRIDTSVVSNDDGSNTTTQMRSDLLTSNQLVIAGSEDLGGGLKASFTVSSPFASDTNSSGFNFGGRGMIVGVSGAFGKVDLGRSTGNMGNSIMASSVVGNVGNLGVTEARPNNSISYTAPAMSGLTARLLVGIGSETAGDSSAGRQVEISGEYKAGSVLLRASHAQHTAAAGGNDSTETGFQADVAMAFGKLNIRYMNLDVDNGDASDTTRYGVGVAIPVGAGLTAAVDFWNHDAAGSASDKDVTTVALIKDLSKRTNVYAAYSATDTNGKDSKVAAIGVRHNF